MLGRVVILYAVDIVMDRKLVIGWSVNSGQTLVEKLSTIVKPLLGLLNSNELHKSEYQSLLAL